MAWFEFFWSPEIEAHLAEHGINPEEFEEVVMHPVRRGLSRTQPRRFADGRTAADRYIRCVYELMDDGITVVPVTAYDRREP